MTLEGLQYGGLDLVLLLAEELFGGGVQQVRILHNLDLYEYKEFNDRKFKFSRFGRCG